MSSELGSIWIMPECTAVHSQNHARNHDNECSIDLIHSVMERTPWAMDGGVSTKWARRAVLTLSMASPGGEETGGGILGGRVRLSYPLANRGTAIKWTRTSFLIGAANKKHEIVRVEKNRRDAPEAAYIAAMWLMFLLAPGKTEPDADGMYDLSEIGFAPEKTWTRMTPYSLAKPTPIAI